MTPKQFARVMRQKRAFDLFWSLIGFFVLFPFLLIISLLVILDSKGGVLFRQVRVGKDAVPFKILKFRTMIPEADSKGMQITVGCDPRITRIGTLLRKTKLDELPQIINVLRGEMSFVGPRPEVPKYVALYTDEQRKVLTLRPGITDLASIEYRNESEILGLSADPEKTYIEHVMPEKLRLNEQYMQDMSILGDTRIIFLTLLKIIR